MNDSYETGTVADLALHCQIGRFYQKILAYWVGNIKPKDGCNSRGASRYAANAY